MSYVKMSASKMSFIGARTDEQGYGAADAAALYEAQILKLVKEGVLILLDKEVKKAEKKLRKYARGLKAPYQAPKGAKAQEVWEAASAEINEYFVEANNHFPNFYYMNSYEEYSSYEEYEEYEESEESEEYKALTGWEGVEEALGNTLPRKLKSLISSQQGWDILAQGCTSRGDFVKEVQSRSGMNDWEFGLFMQRVNLNIPSDIQWEFDSRWITFFNQVGEEKSLRVLSQREFKLRGQKQLLTEEIIEGVLSLTEELVKGNMFPDLGRCRCLFSTWMTLKKAYGLLSGEILVQGSLSHFEGKEIFLNGEEYICTYPKTQSQLEELGSRYRWCIGNAGYNTRINRGEGQLLILIHEDDKKSVCVWVTDTGIDEMRFFNNEDAQHLAPEMLSILAK